MCGSVSAVAGARCIRDWCAKSLARYVNAKPAFARMTEKGMSCQRQCRGYAHCRTKIERGENVPAIQGGAQHGTPDIRDFAWGIGGGRRSGSKPVHDRCLCGGEEDQDRFSTGRGRSVLSSDASRRREG